MLRARVANWALEDHALQSKGQPVSSLHTTRQAMMLFRRVVDLDKFVGLVYSMLMPFERNSLARRLGPTLTSMLSPELRAELSPTSRELHANESDESAVVFLTEEGASVGEPALA